MGVKVCLALGAVALVIVFYLISRQKGSEGHVIERYGPVKNVRKIPFNNCVQICNQYYTHCVADARYGSASQYTCNLLRNSCNLECYYSDFQRLP